MNYQSIYTYQNRKLFGAAIALICIGGLMYLLYRPQNILLFNILEDCGLMPYVDIIRQSCSTIKLPSFVVNSLPAGLWTASYLLMMFCTTRTYSKRTRLMVCLPLPLSAIVLEFIQLFGWCSGTFDVYDLICYTIPIYLFIKSI